MPVDEAQLIGYGGKNYGIGSLNLGGYMLSVALQGKQPRLRLQTIANYSELTAISNKLIANNQMGLST